MSLKFCFFYKKNNNYFFLNLDTALKFLKQYSFEIGFDSYKELEVCPGRKVCFMSYIGKNPDKPSILLNSHTDVVPADQVKILNKLSS